MKPSGDSSPYGLISNSPTDFLISCVLKNTGHAKLCTHTKGHFDNNSCYNIIRKLRGKLILGCWSTNVRKWVCGWLSFFEKKIVGNNETSTPGYINCSF